MHLAGRCSENQRLAQGDFSAVICTYRLPASPDALFIIATAPYVSASSIFVTRVAWFLALAVCSVLCRQCPFAGLPIHAWLHLSPYVV